MCRLFGLSSGRASTRATFWLLQAPDSLREQSHREPDGTGLGWFDADGEPHLRRQPVAAFSDAAFAREARQVDSSQFIAHVRYASTGSLEVRNTHPFKHEHRLFAHNGVLQGLPELEAHLGQDMRLVDGDTDSERLFALITRETAERAGDVGAGIEAACRWVAQTLPLLSINLLLSSRDGMWALRYPDTHPLYVLAREPGSAMEHNSSIGTRVHCEDGAMRPLVVFASERMDDDPGWRMMSSGELLHVDGNLTISSRTILPDPPAHPLTLADLDAKARASQQPAASPPPAG